MSKPQYRCFFLVLFIFFFFFFMNSYCDDSALIPSKCSTHDCGNGVAIEYPFWYMDVNSSDEVCGYPEFGLSCSGDEPILKLPNNTYYVKSINYANSTITLVDIDVTGQTCPRARHNLTLENLPLGYTNLDLNLSFYFNCTSSPFSFSASAIGCLEFSTKQSYVSMTENQINDVDWIGKCEEKVVATVMRTEITTNGLISEFGGAMNKGFMLDWRTVKGCGSCEDSGGFCGYNKTAEESKCFCRDGTVHSSQCKDKPSNFSPKIFIGVTCGVIGFLVACACICRSKKIPSVTSIFPFQKMVKNNQDFEDFLKNHGPLAIKRYNFSEVKKMTSLFKDKLGQGGYGSVYKGKLFDGRLVAVKLLNASKGDGQEFINEVASISRTSHVNVVTILGFCLEGKKRALIYEFMSNGSLEKFICHGSTFKIDQHLGWETMHQIAIGIARGLEYLHRGCNTRIVHFDIKPHNILLDENFCPKISDFGLAKLCTKKESTISMLEARGTIGYIAPEVFSRNFGRVSSKSDVYSYGMMVLEMVGGMEEDDEVGTDNSSEKYFPQCIYRRLEQGNNYELLGEISIEEIEIVRKLTMVGLWCIQTIPSHRPSMSKVIEMLQGSIETLNIPPKPSLSCPPPFPASSFTISVA